MVSAFRGVLDFFDQLGVYDVILPFLLIFVIVFGILERTKIFGTDKVAGKEITKKNINAMVAFVIALLTVASSKIIAIINQGLAQVALLLVVLISFLMLAGTFYVGREFKLDESWQKWGALAVFIGVILIFAYQVGWLTPFWDYVTANWDSTVVGSVIFVILIIWFIIYVTKGPATEETPKKKEETV